MKNIKPFYAIKSNPDINLINILQKNPYVGFDVASINEMSKTKQFLKSNGIVYSNPCKTIEEIQYAKDNGISLLVVDDISELLKIYDLYPEADIMIRIQSIEKYSAITFNSKFGADYNGIMELIKFITDKKINFVGFSYHVGSKCENMLAHNLTLKSILDIYIPILMKNNLKIKLINIGGGFTDYNDLINFDSINNSLVNYLIENWNIKFIAEPGRYFSQNYLSLIATVKSARKMNNVNIVSINDSIYHTFNGIINDKQKYIPKLIGCNQRPLIDTKIFGQTCDSGDIINPLLKMPELKYNDKLLYENIGAYSLTDVFNGYYGAEIIE